MSESRVPSNGGVIRQWDEEDFRGRIEKMAKFWDDRSPERRREIIALLLVHAGDPL